MQSEDQVAFHSTSFPRQTQVMVAAADLKAPSLAHMKERPMGPKFPELGDEVVYVLPDGPHKGEARPARITRVWNPECVNLDVLLDGTNDAEDPEKAKWRTSVLRFQNQKNGPLGTWYFPA